MVDVLNLSDNINASFSDYIPYIDIEDNLIFFKDMSIACINKISFFYDDVMSDKQICKFKNDISSFVNSLDEDLYCQFYFKKNRDFDELLNNHKHINQSNNELVKELFDVRINFLKRDIDDYNVLNYSLYFSIRKKYDFGINPVEGIFNSDSSIRKKTYDKLLKSKKDIKNIETKYIEYLHNIGINIIKPTEKQVIDILSSHINLDTCKNVVFNKKEDLCLSDMCIEYDYILCNGTYASIITFNTLPESSIPTIIKYIIKENHNFDYDISFNFIKLYKDKIKPKLKINKRFVRAFKEDSDGDIDSDSQAKEQNIKDLLDSLVSPREQLFNVELIILVKAKNINDLSKNVDSILSAIKRMDGAQGFKETFATFNLFLGSLPGNSCLDNYRNLLLRTSSMTDFLPVFGPLEGSGDPLMILRNKYNSLSFFNPLNETYPNKNGLIIGGSGSGKSFIMNMVSCDYLAFDPIITIIDKEGSYRKFTENIGGDIFEVSFNDDGIPNYRINPFEIDLEDKDKFYRSLISSMVKENNIHLTNDDKIVIDDSISLALKTINTYPTISDFVDIIGQLEYDDEILIVTRDKIRRHLSRWTKGKYGELFNNNYSNFDISKDIICIDVHGLDGDDELMEVFMLYISSICKYKIVNTDDNKKKLFIFDEVWKMFLSERGGVLIEELYRTIRKHGGIFTISQAIDDFDKSPYASGILSNISFFYVLKQGDGADYDTLQKVLKLTDREMYRISEFKSIKGFYSDMLIKTPDLQLIGKFVPSGLEYWIASNDKNDNVLFEKIYNDFNKNISKTLIYLADNYPHGSVYGKVN